MTKFANDQEAQDDFIEAFIKEANMRRLMDNLADKLTYRRDEKKTT